MVDLVRGLWDSNRICQVVVTITAAAWLGLMQWKAIESIAAKLGINHETLRIWVRRAETDVGLRPGLTTDERSELRELQRELKELRRANEILKSAAAFFGFM